MKLSVLSLAASIAIVGCSSASSESTDSDQGAISHEQAADELKLEEHTLRDVPASPQNVTKLGIKKWNVYSNVDDTFEGIVAFATDTQEDVKYALIVDARSGQATIIQYDKAGATPAVAIPRETYDALLIDFAMLRDRITAATASAPGLGTQAMGARANCGLRLAGAALGAVVIGGGIAFTAWVFTVPAAIAALELGLAGAALAADERHKTALVAKVVVREFNATVDTCKAALKGE